MLVFAGALLGHPVPATSTLCAALKGCELPAELLLFAADLVKQFPLPAEKQEEEKKKGNRKNKKQSMKLMKVEEYFWYYNVTRIRFL